LNKIIYLFMKPPGIFLIALIIVTPLIFCNTIPARDVAFRYAPMADAFADNSKNYIGIFCKTCEAYL